MIGELIRFAYLPSCTLGWMQFGPLRLATIERPWIPHSDGPGGKLRESCVPDATYFVQPWNSAKFPNTYMLVNNAAGVYAQPNLIPPGQKFGRSAILIHVGNTVSDVIGCIAVGTEHGSNSVSNSRIAMERLRSVLGSSNHSLVIRPFAGTQEVA